MKFWWGSGEKKMELQFLSSFPPLTVSYHFWGYMGIIELFISLLS
jgi:hypothetical protein